MAITANWNTKTFTIPQADLTLVSGSLYEMDTEVDFRQAINAIMAGEEGIVFEDPIDHNTQYSVAGVTYARKVEVINGYSIEFSPNSQWTVRLAASNNNLFDVENGILNQNQVQVIAQNSAGLQIVTTGSGLDAGQDAKLTNINNQLTDIEGTYDHVHMMRAFMAVLCNKLSGAHSGQSGTAVVRDVADSKNRISLDFDANGTRTTITIHDLD